jgi:hypothetical protein
MAQQIDIASIESDIASIFTAELEANRVCYLASLGALLGAEKRNVIRR